MAFPKYRVVQDGVGGQRCYIVYEGDKPLATIWEDQLFMEALSSRIADLTDVHEIGDVVQTVKALGGTREQVKEAVERLFKEKGWLKETP